MNTAPPTPERHTWQLYLHMTRPGFLLVTAIGCLIGLASAAACGCGFDTAKATATVVLAVLAHASANVLNDYFDSRNGADTANQQGMFPFSGGGTLHPERPRVRTRHRSLGHGADGPGGGGRAVAGAAQRRRLAVDRRDRAFAGMGLFRPTAVTDVARPGRVDGGRLLVAGGGGRRLRAAEPVFHHPRLRGGELRLNGGRHFAGVWGARHRGRPLGRQTHIGHSAVTPRAGRVVLRTGAVCPRLGGSGRVGSYSPRAHTVVVRGIAPRFGGCLAVVAPRGRPSAAEAGHCADAGGGPCAWAGVGGGTDAVQRHVDSAHVFVTTTDQRPGSARN